MKSIGNLSRSFLLNIFFPPYKTAFLPINHEITMKPLLEYSYNTTSRLYFKFTESTIL